jgi:signal peptidase II
MIAGLLIAIIATVGLIALDLLIKEWVVTALAPIGSMDFLKIGDVDLIGLRYTENTGAAFSFFRDSPLFLTIVVIVLLFAVIVYGVTDREKRTFKSICLVMIVSGGLGNLIDRIRNGYVVDYIELRFMNFAIFNFADILVTCGAFMFFLYIIFGETRNKRNGSDKSRRERIRREISQRNHYDYDR